MGISSWGPLSPAFLHRNVLSRIRGPSPSAAELDVLKHNDVMTRVHAEYSRQLRRGVEEQTGVDVDVSQ
jgi:hypothetical protein